MIRLTFIVVIAMLCSSCSPVDQQRRFMAGDRYLVYAQIDHYDKCRVLVTSYENGYHIESFSAKIENCAQISGEAK